MNRTFRGFAGASCCLVFLGVAGLASGTRAGAPRPADQGVVHVVHAAGSRIGVNQSNNWSGYNIGAAYPGEPAGVRFTAVSGEWTVPTARQHTKGQAEHSATWAGIGGGCVTSNCQVTDNTLIQAGTAQDVSKAGKASYVALWEIIP